MALNDLKKNDSQTIYIDEKYELISQISCTVNAKIFKAYDRIAKKYVAIKIIKVDENKNNNYWNEINILSQLNSLFTPKFIDYCEYGENAVCIVMELYESITLKEKMKIKGLWSLNEQLLIFKSILEAISDIHGHNIIHNDLKPENIIYIRTGKIKIVDFGISFQGDKTIRLNKIKGTPKYIAPEILNIKKCDKRSDIYSLGIILYELLTGVSPFENYNKMEIIKQQANNKCISPITINSKIGNKMSNIILKALETNPKNRFQTVEEFAKEFNSCIGK